MDELHSEDKFVRVPHWVMDYQMSADLNGTQQKIFTAIVRSTYGYNQNERWLSVSYLSKLTKCHEEQVKRELRKMIQLGVIIQRIDQKKRFLQINPKLGNELGSFEGNGLGSYMGNELGSLLKKENKERDIKEKLYIDFDQIDDTFINFYLEYYKKAMKKEHVKISEESYMFIETQINHLIDCGTEQKEWEQQVKQFFKDPIHTPNNRSIVYFLNITYRYFDVGRYDQFDK
jgi:phage replication O-like protein O